MRRTRDRHGGLPGSRRPGDHQGLRRRVAVVARWKDAVLLERAGGAGPVSAHSRRCRARPRSAELGQHALQHLADRPIAVARRKPRCPGPASRVHRQRMAGIGLSWVDSQVARGAARRCTIAHASPTTRIIVEDASTTWDEEDAEHHEQCLQSLSAADLAERSQQAVQQRRSLCDNEGARHDNELRICTARTGVEECVAPRIRSVRFAIAGSAARRSARRRAVAYRR